MKVKNKIGFDQGETFLGDLSEYLDLFLREEKRSWSTFEGQPHDYEYIAQVSPDKRVTVIRLFLRRELIGAGVAVRCESDDYYESAGLRLAMSRALASVG